MTGSNKTVKVFAPASVANVAVGYDILGFAIDGMGDDILVREGSSEGLSIKSIHHNKALSKDISKNTAGVAAYELLKSLGKEDEPIEMEIYKNMSVGTGLGSSAASAVAGAYAVNAYLGKPYDKYELLKFATLGEQAADGSFHADNVAPSMLGSFILVRDNPTLDCVKLPVPSGLRAVIVHPKIEVLTKDSRSILSEEVRLSDHIRQSANLGGFLIGLYKSDFELMKRSLNDLIIEKQRSHLIPEFDKVKASALEHGALGCSISGAGPSVFCLCNNSLTAENIQSAWSHIYQKAGIDNDCFIANIDMEGVREY